MARGPGREEGQAEGVPGSPAERVTHKELTDTDSRSLFLLPAVTVSHKLSLEERKRLPIP